MRIMILFLSRLLIIGKIICGFVEMIGEGIIVPRKEKKVMVTIKGKGHL